MDETPFQESEMTLAEQSPVEPLNVVSARKTLVGITNPQAEQWDGEALSKPKRSPLRFVGYFVVAVVSFLVFLYLTFPYGVVKELMVAKVSEGLIKGGYPIRLSIGAFKPYWFTGVQFEDVKLANITSPTASLSFKRMTSRVNVLPLILGRLSIDAALTQTSGSLEFEASIPISSILKGGTPSFAKATFKTFSLDGFFQQALAFGKNSKEPAMLLIQPILAKSSAGGALTGTLQFSNAEPISFSKSVSDINLSIVKGFFHIDDDALLIPRQNFSTAKFDMKLQSGQLVIQPTTRIAAEDFEVGLKGRIQLTGSSSGQTEGDLDLELIMKGQIEKNLGMIIPNIMRCQPLTNGQLKAKLSGPLSSMACKGL